MPSGVKDGGPRSENRPLALEEAVYQSGAKPVTRRVKSGETLFIAGEEFRCIYPIRRGFFKTNLVDGDGREQVTGFFMMREILGMDGLSSGFYGVSATALEDSEVFAIPYSVIEETGRQNPSVRQSLHAALSSEIVRNHSVMMLLGSMNARERLAAFLLNLSKRLMHGGYSRSQFVLRMRREEIGSYLGLKLETVSRTFSALCEEGLIEVNKKQICIVDINALERIFKSGSPGDSR